MSRHFWCSSGLQSTVWSGIRFTHCECGVACWGKDLRSPLCIMAWFTRETDGQQGGHPLEIWRAFICASLTSLFSLNNTWLGPSLYLCQPWQANSPEQRPGRSYFSWWKASFSLGMATALPREEISFNVALTVYKVCSVLHLWSCTGFKHYNLLLFISFIIQVTNCSSHWPPREIAN